MGGLGKFVIEKRSHLLPLGRVRERLDSSQNLPVSSKCLREPDDAKVRFLGEDVATIYGSEQAIGKDKTHPDAKQCPIWTDTWLKRDGKWQIAAAQDNKVDCK